MSAASRRKGRTGEAELRALFEAAGYVVHAGQRNLASACDILVSGPAGNRNRHRLHVECKRQERLRLPEWLAQAREDAAEGTAPVVVFRQNRGEWYAALSLSDLLKMLA